MKNKILFVAALLGMQLDATAQCSALPVPYFQDVESAQVPALPDCMMSNWNTFGSTTVWQTLAGPIQGYTGNVLAFDTTAEFVTGATVEFRPVQLLAGKSYVLTYRSSVQNGTVEYSLQFQSSVPGFAFNLQMSPEVSTIPTNYSSETFSPPTSGIFYLNLISMSGVNQGYIYLDDVRIEEVATMGTGNHNLLDTNVYPNPVTDVLQLNNSEALVSVSLFNELGQLVYDSNKVESFFTIDMGSLQRGIYMLSLNTKNSCKNIKVFKK